MHTLMLKAGFPTIDDARRRLLRELDMARSQRIPVLKIVHGWGSGGEGGTLGPAIRRSLRLRAKEGRVRTIVVGERFSSDTAESLDLLKRHPALRRDADFNRGNPGITVIELQF